MIIQKGYFGVGKTAFWAVAVLTGLVVTGCQTHSYSKSERAVYNHFDKWSSSVPKGMIAAPAESAGGAKVYAYHDGPPGPVGSGSKRVIRGVFDAEKRELWVWEAAVAKNGHIRLFGFYAQTGEVAFIDNQEAAADNALVVDLMYVLQNEKEAVTYLREKATAAWRQCRLPGVVWSAFDAEKRKDCLLGAEEVTEQQVQRYIDLTRRFYKTYFFIE
ncbi:MAG: hypothetical protein ACYTBJ_07910 [Planctomycetota bacterium]|jgi:hypothetical protein